MATIETLLLPLATRPEQLWTAVAQVTHRWLAQRQVHGADAVVLLPFAELLMPARRALAEVSGWLPRVHTPRTLAAALGPPLPHGPGEITGDAAIDRATARELLRGHAWAAAWRQRDPRAFDAALHRLVRTAQMLRQAALSLPPAQRASWWDQARGQVGTGGMGATDRLLLQAAIEWAALSQQADTDSLYAHRAGAWVVVTLGGDDAVALNVLRDAAQHDVPALHLSADPPALDPFDEWPEQCGFEVEVAPDAETEAMATAWHIAQQVHGGATPIALVAQDRALVRRVRALLERMHIDVVDETGWSLSTTRAGAHATAALRAARAREPCDDVLDWLKADLGDDTAAELSLLERLWRGARVVDARAREQALALWQREQARLDAFVRPGPRMLGRWLQAFDTLLFGAAHSAAWRDDPAAMQLRRALHLHEAGEGAWSAAMTSRWLLDEFSAWVDATLEEAAFVPPRSEQVSVVVTPLPRAIGRTFAAALLPGADEQRLGPLPADDVLLDEALRARLGLPVRAARQRRGALSFVQLLRLPRVLALHRQADGDEMLSVSPWIERLRLARSRRGAVLPPEGAVQLPQQEVAVQGTPRPLPRAAGALPPSLSASAVEALRQCPYRFFSRTVLRLAEHDELDDDAGKRDAGQWLHAALELFHRARPQARSAAEDRERLIAAGHTALAELAQVAGVSEAAMLPFSAGLPALAERYARWLHAHEAQGWTFQAAEVRIDPLATGNTGLVLHGRIDRIDVRAGDGTLRLIDYKTASRGALEDKVRAPLEDTQLAVYAALQRARQPDAQIEACYLALDDADEAVVVMHHHVTDSARELTQQVAAERARIDAGEPLPALGEGAVCDTCEARGLCRRDHWSESGEVAARAA